MADREPNKTPRWGRFSKTASLWVLLFLVPLVLIQMMGTREQPVEELSYTQFRQQLERGNVSEVAVVEGKKIVGELRTPIAGERGQEVAHFETLPRCATRSRSSRSWRRPG